MATTDGPVSHPEGVDNCHVLNDDPTRLRELYDATIEDVTSTASEVDVTITSLGSPDTENYADHLRRLREVFADAYELTADTGSLWVVADVDVSNGRLVRYPFDVADVCENLDGIRRCPTCDHQLRTVRSTGNATCVNCDESVDTLDRSWQLQDVAIWNTETAESTDAGLRRTHRYVLCFSKTDDFTFDLDAIRVADPSELKEWWVDYPQRYNPRGKVPDNIWDYLRAGTVTRPTTGGESDRLPPRLVDRLLDLTTDEGDVVLDPFAGDGTVPILSAERDRVGVGVEPDDHLVAATPEIRDRLRARRERTGATSSASRKQDRLERVICGLRQTRLAREIVRNSRKELDGRPLAELGINSVLMLSHGVENAEVELDRHYVSAEATILVDPDVPKSDADAVESTAKAVTETTPCSTYGVDVTVAVRTPAEAKSYLDDSPWRDCELFLYANDTYNRYVRPVDDGWLRRPATDPDEWRSKHASNQHPPIVSNLGLEVDQPNGTQNGGEERTYRMLASLPGSTSTIKL